ncbi:MAG: hypothetical protein KDK07_05545 [Bauldia sp.]|nr:hypothetical protein [Bauldia sp.]
MVTTPTLYNSFGPVNTAPGNELDAQLLGLSNGNILAVWESDTDQSSSIRARLLDPFGSPIGDTDQLLLGESTATQWRLQPALAEQTKSGGGVLVAYSRYDLLPDDHDIYVQRYSADLVPGTNDAIETSGADTYDPSIASLGDGGYVVSYTKEGSVEDIFLRIVSSSGVVSAPIKMPGSVEGQENDEDQRRSQVIVLDTGEIVVNYIGREQTLPPFL